MTLWFLILSGSYFIIFYRLKGKGGNYLLLGCDTKREPDIERRNVTRMEERMIVIQFHDLFKIYNVMLNKL